MNRLLVSQSLLGLAPQLNNKVESLVQSWFSWHWPRVPPRCVDILFQFILYSWPHWLQKRAIVLLIPFIRNHRYQVSRARSLGISLYRLKIHLLESPVVSRKPSYARVHLSVLFLRNCMKCSSVEFQFLLTLCIYVKIIWDFFPPPPFSQS